MSGRGYWRWHHDVTWFVSLYLLDRINPEERNTLWNGSFAFTQQFLQPGLWGLLWYESSITCNCSGLPVYFKNLFSSQKSSSLLLQSSSLVLPSWKGFSQALQRQIWFSLLTCDVSCWPFGASVNPGHCDTSISPKRKEEPKIKGLNLQSFHLWTP